jgi:hypothetical protein
MTGTGVLADTGLQSYPSSTLGRTMAGTEEGKFVQL